jgi:zinc protease
MVSRLLSALIALAVLAPLAAPPSAAQPAAPAVTQKASLALPAGVRKVGSVEGINEYELANGLRVLLYPDQSKPTVTVNITFKVGSRMENYGETGMAHLLEHLIFKGSKNYPKPDVEFNRRGFRNNGTTSFDRTNYFSTFQASDDNLRWAIGWSADAMVNSFIAKKDLDSEMTVVRNEYEMGENQPGQVMFKRMFALMYDWHNYAKLPIGNRSDIENVRIENLQAFYRMYYQPDNAVLSIAGKFDEAKTLGWIAESFGKIPRPKRTLPVFWTTEPTHDGERSFVVRRAGSVQMVLVAYRIPSALAIDTPALSTAVEVLGNTPNGRLHRELVEKGLAAQVFAFPMFLRDPGLVMFGAVVKPGEPLEPIRARVVEVVEGLAQQPPTEEELTRVKRDAETEYSRALADPQDFGISLSEYIALGDWRLFFVSRDQAQQVTSAQVAAAAGRYFLRDNRGVGMFIPEDKPQRAEIPAPLAVADILKDFKPRAAVAAGEVFDPSQDNIDKRTRIIRMGDLKVALLPKQTRGQTVDVSMVFRYGDERSLQGKALQRTLTDAMLLRGTSKLTRPQIADEFTRLKMQGGLRQFQTERAQLADALRLVAHVMRDASFPQAEVDLLKREIVTGLEAQRTDPTAAANDLLQSVVNTYPPGDPRSYITIAQRLEQVPKITRDELVAFHKQFFGTARGEIAIVGDFDDKEIERLVRELFADWASPAPYARILSEPRPTPPKRLIAATPDKENATYIGRIVVAMRDDDPDLPAMLLANYIFGGGSGLANRLTDRVRQRDGLSYGIGSNLNINGLDRAGSFGIFAIAAPQNMAKVEAAIREELERSVRDGFTAKEIEDARNGLLQQRVLARSEDPTLAANWVNNLDLDRSFQFSKAVEARLRSLTVAEVNAAWRRHIDPAKMTVAIGGDPAKGIK